MARSIAQIQAEIQAIVGSQSSLSALNLSPSQTSIYQLWENIFATELNIEESLWDLYSAMLDQIIASAPISTDQWVYERVLEFQYDATTPQVVSVNPLNGFTVGYNPIDTTKRIISQAAVITQPNRLVSVKVATGTPPSALSSLEMTAFSGYLDEISPAGVQYVPISLSADLLLVEMNIFFNGQYAPTIQTVVAAAVNSFISNLPFNGQFRLSTFEQYLLNIPGVTDVDFINLALAPASSGVYFYLVQNYTEVVPSYPLISGYATLSSSTINYIAS